VERGELEGERVAVGTLAVHLDARLGAFAQVLVFDGGIDENLVADGGEAAVGPEDEAALPAQALGHAQVADGLVVEAVVVLVADAAAHAPQAVHADEHRPPAAVRHRGDDRHFRAALVFVAGMDRDDRGQVLLLLHREVPVHAGEILPDVAADAVVGVQVRPGQFLSFGGELQLERLLQAAFRDRTARARANDDWKHLEPRALRVLGRIVAFAGDEDQPAAFAHEVAQQLHLILREERHAHVAD
jgi:hypothetical protein